MPNGKKLFSTLPHKNVILLFAPFIYLCVYVYNHHNHNVSGALSCVAMGTHNSIHKCNVCSIVFIFKCNMHSKNNTIERNTQADLVKLNSKRGKRKFHHFTTTVRNFHFNLHCSTKKYTFIRYHAHAFHMRKRIL